MSQKNPPARIKSNIITDAKKALKALAKTPPEDFRLKEAVYQLIPEILDARSSHHNDEVIAETLGSLGIQISASTLGSYVRSYFKDQKAEKAPQASVDEKRPDQDAPKAQVGEAAAETRKPDGIEYIPIEDMLDEGDEEFTARILKRRAHDEVDETLADLEEALEAPEASETNEEQM